MLCHQKNCGPYVCDVSSVVFIVVADSGKLSLFINVYLILLI